MRRSEKILLAVLVLGLLAWQGGRLVDRLMFDPVRRRSEQLARLDERIAEQKNRDDELARAEASLRRWRQRSLPPDPLTAQRLYQRWLTDLAQDCGFQSPKVFPDQVRPKGDACVEVLVSVEAQARLSQLCLFLSRFYQTDLAQQITWLNIDSTQDRGDPLLRVTIMAEGLSLRDAPQRQRLFPTSQLARDMDTGDSTAQIVDEQTFPTTTGGLLRIGGEYMRVVKATGEEWLVKRGAERSVPVAHARGELVEFIPLIDSSAGTAPVDYANLLARNPFAKPTPVVAEPTRVVEEAAPAIDPAEFTYLVAAFVQADKRQAWFYDRLNNQNFVVGTGNPFSVAGIDGVVQAIGNGFILLDHDNSHWRLRLGKNLRSMERVSSATESAQEPSEEG